MTAILQSLDPTTDDGVLPVSSGRLLLTSGPNRGDVVKFHRFKCVAFGRSLASADISYIFHHEEKVSHFVQSRAGSIPKNLGFGIDLESIQNPIFILENHLFFMIPWPKIMELTQPYYRDA